MIEEFFDIDKNLSIILPATLKIAIFKTALIFGDTNMSIHGRELLYAFLVNPTGELGIWRVTEDGAHLEKSGEDFNENVIYKVKKQ